VEKNELVKTLVLGLGNPILSDDAVGLEVAARLEALIKRPEITVLQTELGGINLLELLAGYDRAVIIDAITTPEGKPGQIYQLSPRSLRGTRHTDSTHGLDFAGVLELGKRLGMKLPGEVIILAIEAKDVTTFNEGCSAEVKGAIPRCVEKIAHLLGVGLPELTFG